MIDKLESLESWAHRHFREPEIILFGSRLLGTSHKDSDVDLVIVSDSFLELGLIERRKILSPGIAELGWKADVMAMTPREWARPSMFRAMVESQLRLGDEWRRLLEQFESHGEKRKSMAWETLCKRSRRAVLTQAAVIDWTVGMTNL